MSDRIRWTRHHILLALLVGGLVGAACDDDLAALADAGVTLLAGDVPFDDSTAALGVADVQAALEMLAARLQQEVAAGAERDSRLSAVESEAATASGAMTAMQEQVDGLDTRLEAVELAIPDAALMARVAALEAALLEVQTEQATQAGAVAELQDPSCPEGFYETPSACVEAEPRSVAPWYIARQLCRADGMRLCTLQEYGQACSVGLKGLDQPEWTSDWIGVETVLTSQFGDVDFCANAVGSSNHLEELAHRCCTER